MSLLESIFIVLMLLLSIPFFGFAIVSLFDYPANLIDKYFNKD